LEVGIWVCDEVDVAEEEDHLEEGEEELEVDSNHTLPKFKRPITQYGQTLTVCVVCTPLSRPYRPYRSKSCNKNDR
jgi:hypothetical protein